MQILDGKPIYQLLTLTVLGEDIRICSCKKEIEYNGKKYSPVNYDFSINHLFYQDYLPIKPPADARPIIITFPTDIIPNYLEHEILKYSIEKIKIEVITGDETLTTLDDFYNFIIKFNPAIGEYQIGMYSRSMEDAVT